MGDPSIGGVIVYPLDRLYQELSYLAYHYHWSYEQIVQLDHRERQQWVREVAAINRQLNGRMKEEA